ncbi:hypothetical protein [Gorillibacterium sp. CAU 1737]|uniref:hypothetical protein n=1 Tax=Gorillibacterium sp. CAU 1737 TaxID=3140362 RepID=UPI0032604A8D
MDKQSSIKRAARGGLMLLLIAALGLLDGFASEVSLTSGGPQSEAHVLLMPRGGDWTPVQGDAQEELLHLIEDSTQQDFNDALECNPNYTRMDGYDYLLRLPGRSRDILYTMKCGIYHEEGDNRLFLSNNSGHAEAVFSQLKTVTHFSESFYLLEETLLVSREQDLNGDGRLETIRLIDNGNLVLEANGLRVVIQRNDTSAPVSLSGGDKRILPDIKIMKDAADPVDPILVISPHVGARGIFYHLFLYRLGDSGWKLLWNDKEEVEGSLLWQNGTLQGTLSFPTLSLEQSMTLDKRMVEEAPFMREADERAVLIPASARELAEDPGFVAQDGSSYFGIERIVRLGGTMWSLDRLVTDYEIKNGQVIPVHTSWNPHEEFE